MIDSYIIAALARGKKSSSGSHSFPGRKIITFLLTPPSCPYANGSSVARASRADETSKEAAAIQFRGQVTMQAGGNGSLNHLTNSREGFADRDQQRGGGGRQFPVVKSPFFKRKVQLLLPLPVSLSFVRLK